MSARPQRLAELAPQAPQRGFTSRNHPLDLTGWRGASGGPRRDGATGGDGITAADYEADLNADRRSLLDRAQSGSYRAPPVRRAHLAKGPGSTGTRPIGIPTPEDEVLQRAVVMLRQAIDEQDFQPCSYGFRPGRSAHQALEDLQHQRRTEGRGGIWEVDLRKFFDPGEQAHVRERLRRRVRDGVVRRRIGQGRSAGVREGGAGTYPSTGSPQGGVLSP